MPRPEHKHMMRLQGRTPMGWQFEFECRCGIRLFPGVEVFGARYEGPEVYLPTKEDWFYDRQRT